MASLKKLAFRGAIWTIGGYGISQVLRFGTNLVLTRLLVPEYFGLMAVVNTLRAGIDLFSDLGISQSIVNNKQGDEPQFLNTAWTLQVIRGLFLWMFCLLITLPAANFYDDRRLLWLIPIVGLSSVLDGFSSSAIHTLMRRMDLGRLTRFDMLIQFVSAVTLVLLAWFYRSIWSLAIGVVAGAVYRMIGSHWLISGYKNRFAWDKDSLKELLSFGRWIFVATALMFMAEQADRLILGKLLSFQLLGVYTVAYTLANIPREIIKRVSHRVIFPAISNKTDISRSMLRSKIIHQRGKMLMAFAILLAALITVGDLVIGTLYDQRYTQATWMMPILCSGIWFSILFFTISPALLAIGKPLYSAQSNFARFFMIGVGLPVSFQNFGLIGVIVAIALSDLPLYIVNLYGLWREKLSCFIQDMQATAFFAGVLSAFLLIRYYLGYGLPIDTILSNLS